MFYKTVYRLNFKDAILIPRFAGSEFSRQGGLEAAGLHILLVITSIGPRNTRRLYRYRRFGIQGTRRSIELFLKKFTKFLCNESLPSLFRCKPLLFSPFWVMLAWLISFHPFCLEDCFSPWFTVFTASLWASFRVVISDKTISASQEFSISLARSTIASHHHIRFFGFQVISTNMHANLVRTSFDRWNYVGLHIVYGCPSKSLHKYLMPHSLGQLSPLQIFYDGVA